MCAPIVETVSRAHRGSYHAAVPSPEPPSPTVGSTSRPAPGDAFGRRLGRSAPSLGTWVASLAADEAASRRARVQWLRRQAEEEGTFAGVLADLGDRHRPVVVTLRGDRRHRGTVVLLGTDLCALRLGNGREVLLRLADIVAVQTLPTEPVTAGDRAVRAELSLAEALALLAGERARLLIVHDGGRLATTGEARACGQDVLTVRLDGDGGTSYVALASVSEVSLPESG